MSGTLARKETAARPASLGSRAVVVGAAVVAFGVLGWCFVWPLVAIVSRGIGDSSQPLGTLARSVFTSDRTLRIVAFTLGQAVVSTVATLVLGVPLAGIVSRLEMRGAAFVRVLVTVPFVLPTVVVASGFVALAGPGGPLAGLGLVPSVVAVVLAHVVFNLAVVVRVVGARWAGLDPEIAAAARVLGAGPLRVWTSVSAPLLAPAIAAAAAVVFCFCLTSFGVVLVLGGVGRATLETEIYRLTTQELALDRAAVLVVVQLVAVALTASCAGRFGRSATVVSQVGARTVRRPVRARSTRLAAGAVLGFAAVLVVAPIAAVFVRALRSTSTSWSLLGGHGVGAVDGLAALRASMASAGAAAVIALVVGCCAAIVVVHGGRLGRVADGLVVLPLGVSAVTVGFGFLIALDRPIDLRGSWWIVPLAQAMVGVPFVVRIVVPAWRAIDPDHRAVAATLGVAPARVRARVDLPMLRRALWAATVLAGCVALGEFGATVFLARADTPTLPLTIVRLLGRPGVAPHDAAMVLSAGLAVVVVVAAVVADRLSTSRQGY